MNVRAFLGVLVFSLSLGGAEVVNFDLVTPGVIPPGWSVTSTHKETSPHWKVQVDKTAPSRPHVLARIASKSGREDESLALFENHPCTNGDVSVNLKLIGGKLEQSAGLIWRFRDPGNYYFALASADKDKVGIYKRQNNQVSLLQPALIPHRIDDQQWNVLKVVFRGSKFSLFFGHRKLVDIDDKTFSAAGKTGLWTRADTVAYFDNFRLNRRD